MKPIDVTDDLNSRLTSIWDGNGVLRATCSLCASEYIVTAMRVTDNPLTAVLKRHRTHMPMVSSLVLKVTMMDLREADFRGADKISVSDERQSFRG